MSDTIKIPCADNPLIITHNIEDVRKALADYYAKQAEPEKIDNLTMAEWDRVIKVKQPCEFWDAGEGDWEEKLTGKLTGVAPSECGTFDRYDFGYFDHCRPIIQQGQTHVWWPEIGTNKKPEGLADDARVIVHCKAMDVWFCLTEARKVMWKNMDAFYWPVTLAEAEDG